MKYAQPSFSVPASAGNAQYCAEHGHTMPDVRGKCVRCGERYSTGEYVRTLLSPTDHVAVITSETDLRCPPGVAYGIPCSDLPS